MSNRTVSVTLTANIAQYMAALRTAGAATAGFAASGTKLASQVGVVNTKMAGLATGIGFVAATGVATMAQFEYSMSRVKAVTQESTAVMGDLREAALAVGGDTIFTPTNAAEGMAILAKAGVDAADILGGGLTGALNLAAAGEMSVQEASEIAASALNTFRLEGEKMPHVADLLASTANAAQGEVHDLGFALRMTAAVAAQTGLTIEETMAGLGAMANRGLLNSDAGTSMKSFLIHLVPTTDTAAKEMKKIGLAAFDAQGQFIGLKGVADQLKTGLADLSQEEQLMSLRTIFGTDAIRAAAVMYEEGAAGVQKWIDVNKDGYAEGFTKILNDNLIGDVKKLRGELEELFIGAGQGANGPLRELTQSLTEVLGAVTALDKKIAGDGSNGPGLFGSVWDVGRRVNDLILNKRPKIFGGQGFMLEGPTAATGTVDTTRSSHAAQEHEGEAAAAANAAAATNNLLNAVDNLAVANSNAAGSAGGLAGASYNAAAAARELAAASGGAGQGVASLDAQMRAALDGAMGYIDAMQAVVASESALAGMGDALHDSALQPATSGGGGGGSGGSSAASKAATKANNEHIKRIREADQKKQNAEIEAARKRAQARAEARADKEARGEVTAGVKEFIKTDKKAKAGENIDGFNNTGSVGEKAGSLNDKEQKRLDKEIEGIRKRHKKALDEQVKGLKAAQKAASGTASATREYNTTLDKNTEAGRKNIATISSQVDVIQASAEAAFNAVILNKGTVDEAAEAARTALQKGYDELVKSAEKWGYNTDQVKALIVQMGLIPRDIVMLLRIEYDDSQLTELEKRLKAADIAIRSAHSREEHQPTEPTPTKTVYGKDSSLPEQYRAGGGEVYGSGTGTSDSVRLRASRGEYVIRASQYAANRDLVKAINGSTGKVGLGGGSVGVLIEGGVHVTAPSPAAAGENVIDELDMYAYRKGAVR